MSKKTRVLFIIESLSYGGVERRRLALVRQLSSRIDFGLICSAASGDLIHEFAGLGVPVYPVGVLGKLWNFPVYRNTIRAIKEFKPDIIHGGVFEGVVLANICGTLCRVPVIISEETSAPIHRSRKASLLLRILLLRSHFVIAVSASVREYLKDVAKINPVKIRLIHNAVPLPRQVDPYERDAIRTGYRIGEKDFIVGSVGRQFPIKRYQDLIRAVAGLPVKLLLVGGGLVHDRLKALACELGIDDRVIFTGYQKDPVPFYQVMDVFCLLSESESFGLVLVEAMYQKLPVIATEVGGMKEIVVHGRTGYLTPPYRPDQVSRYLLKMIEDKALRSAMGAAGYKRALETFDIQQYAEKIRQLYHEALAGS